jgi:hypothetical protein
VIVADLIDSAILNFQSLQRRWPRSQSPGTALSTGSSRQENPLFARQAKVCCGASGAPRILGRKQRAECSRPASTPTNKRVEGLSRLTEWVKSHFPRLVMRPHALPIVDYQVNIRRASGVRADIRFRTSPRNRHAASCRWSLSARRAYRATTEPSAPAGPGSRRGQG